ncbi:MAG: hypothetical protein NZL87_08250, partial [Thermomicrobium sp.]|nr:hypothetical protein [Thermomicrobium sp.]
PPGELSPFARRQHRWRGLDDAAVVALRREEERAAAEHLGAEAAWFDAPDAIYRGMRYSSETELFGPVHPDDLPLVEHLLTLVEERIACDRCTAVLFVPLAVGNHVDHQIVRTIGLTLAARGQVVWGYEDLPYAAAPGGLDECRHLADRYSGAPPWLVFLSEGAFQHRLAAIRCYRSQIPFIVRELGDVEATLRGYTSTVGRGRLAERFWQLRTPRDGTAEVPTGRIVHVQEG